MTDLVVRRAREAALNRASRSGDSLQVIVGMSWTVLLIVAGRNTPSRGRGANTEFVTGDRRQASLAKAAGLTSILVASRG